jgi:hypothetical protein
MDVSRATIQTSTSNPVAYTAHIERAHVIRFKLHKGRPQERETRNIYTIHQHLEAKHTTESLIKITGSIQRNTECTVANTIQGKLHKTQKGKGREVYSLPTQVCSLKFMWYSV